MSFFQRIPIVKEVVESAFDKSALEKLFSDRVGAVPLRMEPQPVRDVDVKGMAGTFFPLEATWPNATGGISTSTINNVKDLASAMNAALKASVKIRERGGASSFEIMQRHEISGD